VGLRSLDLVLQWFFPQRLGTGDAQDDQRQPDAEGPADAEMLGDIAEQWRSQQERDERDLCQRCNVSRRRAIGELRRRRHRQREDHRCAYPHHRKADKRQPVARGEKHQQRAHAEHPEQRPRHSGRRIALDERIGKEPRQRLRPSAECHREAREERRHREHVAHVDRSPVDPSPLHDHRAQRHRNERHDRHRGHCDLRRLLVRSTAGTKKVFAGPIRPL
jgi:hypothetical protein